MQKANTEIAQFNTAFSGLNTINEQYRQGLLNVVNALKDAETKLKEFNPSSGRNISAQTPRQDDGESSARGPRGTKIPGLGGM